MSEIAKIGLVDAGFMAVPSEKEVIQALEHLDKILGFVHEASVGERVVSLLDSSATLILHANNDPDAGPEDGYTVTVFQPNGQPITCTRMELLDALRAVFPGGEPSKRCQKCNRVKPLSAFSHYKDSRDGHNHRCRKCETIRAVEGRRQRRTKPAPAPRAPAG